MILGIEGLAIGAFVGTSTDDFAVLVALLTKSEIKPSVVFLAKLLSAATLLGCGCVLALLSVGFAGLPGYVTGSALLATGLAKTMRPEPDTPDPVTRSNRGLGGLGCWLSFTLSGTDNCVAYMSLFAGARRTQIVAGAGTILILTLSLCIAAYAIARRLESLRGGWIVGRLAPCLLILLGIRSLIAPLVI